MFDFLTGGKATALNPLMILANIALAFFLSVLISWIYKKTHSGLSYSRSFVFTLILMSILISVVMTVVGNNLASAFTLLGAFTIIRFRTAIKETRDIAFVFWALVIGMAVGTGGYLSAIIATAAISGIILFLSKVNFGSMKNYDHVLVFLVDTSIAPGDVYKALFNKYLKYNNLMNISTREEGKKMDFTFSVRFINDDDASAFIAELKNTGGISNISLMTAKNDIEY